MIKKLRKSAKSIKSLTEIFHSPGYSRDGERINITTSCRDTDYIKKVANAGEIITKDGKEYQVMHNGIEVVHGGYFGDWMSTIITSLKGHHEPQEEMIFHEVLKRISSSEPTMMELGSFWAYYSMWFKKSLPKSKVHCYEPDEVGLALGKENAEHNELELNFKQVAAGKTSGEVIIVNSDTRIGLKVPVPVLNVDDAIKEENIKQLDMLHMDIQGGEYDALQGAEQSILDKKIRFLFVSTHHHSISGSPDIHNTCLSYIKSLGGHIICEHSVSESYSGDGLIVASFKEEDADFTVTTSYNRASKALFREPEAELAVLAAEYDKLYNKLT